MSPRRSLRNLVLLSALIWVAGCTPADRWKIFAADQQAPDQVEPSLAVEPMVFSLPSIEQAAESPPLEDSSELSVEQAVMLALRNNHDLKVQQLTPTIVGSFEEIERGSFDPELFAEAEYFKEKATETSRSSGEQFNVAGHEVSGVAGLRQFLPTGTTIEASISQERSISNRTPEEQIARTELSLTQALLRGFSPKVNLASVRQAELDTRASIEELRGFTEALVADTEIAYWNFVLTNKEIAIFEESLEVAKKQREEIELRIEVGILPEIEVAAARAEEALRIQALINARSQLEDRRLRLLRLINPRPDDQFDLALTATSDPQLQLQPQPITDLVLRVLLAEQSRPDLNEARLRLQRNRLETIQTRNGLLPRLDLFISLGKTGYAGTFSDSFRELNGSTYDLTAGLNLSHYLGNRSARASHLAALGTRQKAREAVANLRQLVHFDVRLAVNEVERSRQQIAASRATRSYQEQTLTAEKERFDVGTSTALLVAQAQRDLLQAQIAEVEAIINYRIALVQLYLAEGSLLDHRGVRISGGSSE